MGDIYLAVQVDGEPEERLVNIGCEPDYGPGYPPEADYGARCRAFGLWPPPDDEWEELRYVEGLER